MRSAVSLGSEPMVCSDGDCWRSRLDRVRGRVSSDQIFAALGGGLGVKPLDEAASAVAKLSPSGSFVVMFWGASGFILL